MVKKNDRHIVDTRLEETLDLFQPTAQQAAAAEDTGQKAETQTALKSRGWENRPENKPFTYRLGQDLDDLVKDAVAEYKAEGWHTSKGEVLRAWALAGRELWLQGEVNVTGREIAPRAGTRRRKL